MSDERGIEQSGFVHESSAQRVVFAHGRAASALADEVARLKPRAVMVIADGPRAESIVVGWTPSVTFDEVVQHVPTEVARRASDVAAAHDVDVVVSIGGGSATGLAKAVALTRDVAIIAVPTTYAGSEATSVWGLTDTDGKRNGVEPAVLPRTVVYDAALVQTLPDDLLIASALNALAHGIDAMWAPSVDPIDQAMAAEGVRAIVEGVRAAQQVPGERQPHEHMLYGTYLTSIAFSSAGSGMHHKICHVLGGLFGLPHAPMHAVVLPHVVAFNADAAPDAMERLGRALGTDDVVATLDALYEQIGAPRSLASLGLREEDLDEAVAAVLPKIPPSNPRPVDADSLARLLRAAWSGERPQHEEHP